MSAVKGFGGVGGRVEKVLEGEESDRGDEPLELAAALEGAPRKSILKKSSKAELRENPVCNGLSTSMVEVVVVVIQDVEYTAADCNLRGEIKSLCNISIRSLRHGGANCK